MEKVKVFCYKCRKNNLNERVFEVVKNRETVFCPTCGALLKVKDARKAYFDTLNSKFNLGRALLKRKHYFSKAYNLYGQLVDFDKERAEPKYGRILAFLKMSTLREPTFDLCIELLNNDLVKVFHKPCNIDHYIDFVHEIDNLLNVYLNNAFKNLTYRNHFYSDETFNLYFERLLQIIKLDKFFIEDLKKIDQLNVKLKNGLTSLRTSLALFEEKKFTSYNFVDGNFYLAKISSGKTTTITHVLDESKKANKPITKKSYPKLYKQENEKCKLVKDFIF